MIPEIGIILKRIIDYIDGIQVFVSGSSSLELANTINEPLTGRKLEYQLFPISFLEMKFSFFSKSLTIFLLNSTVSSTESSILRYLFIDSIDLNKLADPVFPKSR